MAAVLTAPASDTAPRATAPGGSHMPALGLALALAVLFTAVRTIEAWPLLSIGRLPDNDDMMRLAEVRDWLAGQRFSDMSQHRLGPPAGASMHWSRIADLGPAAFLLGLGPLLGEARATLGMLIGYQALLLFAYLALAGRNARLLLGAQAMPVAVIMAALAFPTTTLFLPGRIDHHALQIVLMMVTIGALLGNASWRVGLAGGVATALSLAIGLEAAPELLVAMAVLGLRWLADRDGETARTGGFALGLGGVTLALLAVARPDIWPTEWCDGFTPASTRATMAAAAGFGALALTGPRLRDLRARIGAGVVVAGLTGVYVAASSRVCFAGPYGALDPYLKHVWMENVAEARGLFWSKDGGATVLAYGGLSFASLGAVAMLLRDRANRRVWWPMALFLLLNVVATVAAIRVTYILAGVATLPFVGLMMAARDEARLGRRLLIWLLGCGMTWAMASRAVEAAQATPQKVRYEAASEECMNGRQLRVLAALPRGVVMAPLDSGAYIVGMTQHRSVAAPYHRNNAGNLAMYRFFLSPPARAQAIGRAWRATYVVICPTSLDQDEVQAQRPGSLIEQLQAGRTPAWLLPISGKRTGMMIFRMR